MNKTLNIAQVGVGYWGPNLLRNLVENQKCNVKYIIELSKERRDFVKNMYPEITVIDDFSLILKDDSIHAVVIATPVSTHFNLSKQSLEAGKHILVEKPMATREEEIRELSILAKSKDLVAMVGHTFLYNSAVRKMKDIVDSGELGDLRYIYSKRLNLGRIRTDVDALWNLAPHDISIIQYLLDDPKPISISRVGMDYIQEGIADVVFLNITYPNKVIANIHVSWLDPHKVRGMTVVGSKKMLVYDDIAKDKIKIFDKGIDEIPSLGENMDFDSNRPINYDHRSGETLIPKYIWTEPLKNEINHFINCVNGHEECLTDAEHALNVVRILEKAS